MNMKEWYKSKTVWFGVLWVVIAIANLFGFQSFQPDDGVLKIGELVGGIGIIVLRFVTKEPIK